MLYNTGVSRSTTPPPSKFFQLLDDVAVLSSVLDLEECLAHKLPLILPSGR